MDERRGCKQFSSAEGAIVVEGLAMKPLVKTIQVTISVFIFLTCTVFELQAWDRQTDRQTGGSQHCLLPPMDAVHSKLSCWLWLVSQKGSPYSITERRVPELIPDLGSQPAGDVSHKPGGRLPLLSARIAVTFATLKRAATYFAAW